MITDDKCIEYLSNRSGGTSYPAFKSSDIESYSIPISPYDIQCQVIERLDALSEQIVCLEKIENQVDENAKFVLNGYLGV